MHRLLIVSAIVSLAVACRLEGAQRVKLVAPGAPAPAIVLPKDADPDEKLAAQELKVHVKKICGIDLAVVDADPGKGPRILLGRLALTPDVKKAIEARGADPASFMLKVEPGLVRIAGLSPEGTLFGTYELLEQLGVRWFMPGDFGTVIPATKTLQVAAQTTIQTPSFESRHLQTVSHARPWYRRQRLGGPYFPGAHGIPVRGISLEKNPELFALVDGKRTKRQMCVSNPELIKLTIAATKAYFKKYPDRPWMGIGPNDGHGYCECPNCRALDAGDYDPFEGTVSMTDRYLWFFNQVLDGIKDEYPDKCLCFYSYSTYMRPPVKVKPNPHIIPAFAPISLCRYHGMSNPICPERSYYRALMEQWGKLLPRLYERGYYFNLADPGFLFSKVHAMRDEIPVARKLGIAGWRVETMPHWGAMTPTIYIAPRLYWNCNADVDALLADFYSKFFGPAAAPMARYGKIVDTAFRDGDFHTGCSFNLPDFFPPDRMARMRALLDEAAKLVKPGIYAERVAAWRLMYDYLDAFRAMLAHRNAFDFAAAERDLKTLKAIQAKALAHDPPLLWGRAAVSYVRRFWGPCTEQGFERTSGKNQFVAGCPNTWDFLIDPTVLGEDCGYWRTDLAGGDWQELRTSTASWSDQGLRYYKGDAWYRCRVTVPAKFKGKKIMLWFGGVDELAKVWVNGKLLGTSPGRAFVPFEMDATDAVVAGRANVIAVKITNNRLNELGTGGITAPVMFYAKGE